MVEPSVCLKHVAVVKLDHGKLKFFEVKKNMANMFFFKPPPSWSTIIPGILNERMDPLGDLPRTVTWRLIVGG